MNPAFKVRTAQGKICTLILNDLRWWLYTKVESSRTNNLDSLIEILIGVPSGLDHLGTRQMLSLERRADKVTRFLVHVVWPDLAIFESGGSKFPCKSSPNFWSLFGATFQNVAF